MSIRSVDSASHTAQVALPGSDLATKKDSPDAKKRAEAAKAGRDFEAILVRQLLAQTNIAGKGGGYGDMAVEALATSVTSAGGMGLGRAIEEALAPHTHPRAAPHAPSGVMGATRPLGVEMAAEIPKNAPDSAPRKK